MCVHWFERLVSGNLPFGVGSDQLAANGGDLVRQALNAGLVDEITATFLPVLLGKGMRLFDDLASRTKLQFVARRSHEGGFCK